jgi:hypothetical protein
MIYIYIWYNYGLYGIYLWFPTSYFGLWKMILQKKWRFT